MPILTAIDVLGVQRFIFLSNRLKDIVAGSWLVHWSTSVQDGALSGALKGNKQNIILASGGNAILEFEDLESAKNFASQYTKSLYKEAPGLEVILVHYEYSSGGLATALIKLQKELAKAKIAPPVSAPLLGLSVTATCRETGLSANGFASDDFNAPLSREILKRREKMKEANSRWAEFLQNPNLEFPLELDDLGRSIGDTSLIGIVHIDGNGVGAKIQEWLENQEGEPDEKVRQRYREWSKALDDLGHKAFEAVVKRVLKALSINNDSPQINGYPNELSFKLKKRKQKIQLPLRPIILGGDDLTFVCDGRLALDLAATALKVFREEEIPHLGKITASAGVALVKVHDPFSRAYRLCEDLCSNAKRRLKEEDFVESDCAIDWHIGLPHPSETLENIRNSLYRLDRYELTGRPYFLNQGAKVRTWDWFERELLNFLRTSTWKEHRNKVKKLLELAHEGPEEMERKLKTWKAVFPQLKLPSEIETNGFFGGRTPLVDAVELLDIHLALDQMEEQV